MSSGSMRGRRWRHVRRQVLDRDGWRCRRCGRAGRLEVHHLRALQDGGQRYDPANLEARCRPCHFGEHRRPLEPGALAWKRLVAVIQAGREE